MKLNFLGANRQVTGSRYLLDTGNLKLMIDCGMFQERHMLSRNWDDPPVDPKSIDYLLLTHAHLDHTGLVPRLVSQGFDGSIIATEPSVELAKIIMSDSARIQQEDVKYKKKRHQKENRQSKHPLVPLYTVEDADKAAGLFTGVSYDQRIELGDDVYVTYREAGHILGSASLVIEAHGKRIVFSGDVGQTNKPLIRDPAAIEGGDYVVLESTYGDRSHKDETDVVDQLCDIVNRTIKRGGNVVIPTFAVERAQELVYHLSRLAHGDRIPDVPVFLDSPMAVDVTEVFRRHRDYMDAQTNALFESGQPPLRFPGLKLVRAVEDSIAINQLREPCIIMSSSGMCTGGRIKHHLKRNIGRAESTLVFVGYQAVGTLGRIILDGKDRVRIHGQYWPVNAEIAQIYGFSAHGDREDLLNWLANIDPPPKRVFLTHGDEDAALTLQKKIEQAQVPHYGDEYMLE